MSGFPEEIETLCRRVREVSPVAIVGLTDSNSPDIERNAYNSGITMLLLKPFTEFDLFIQLRNLEQENSGGGPLTSHKDGLFTEKSMPTEPAAGNVRLELETMQACVGDKRVRLTSTEYRLLAELVQNSGLVLSNEMLLERVWGPQYTDSPQYLKVFVHRLRRKLGCRTNGSHYIQNEWGRGYRFV